MHAAYSIPIMWINFLFKKKIIDSISQIQQKKKIQISDIHHSFMNSNID